MSIKTGRTVALTAILISLTTGCMSSGEQSTSSGTAMGAGAGLMVDGLGTGQPLQGAAYGSLVGPADSWIYNQHQTADDN